MSLLTVQQALDRLADEGFVEARGRLGTFVTARPPHLTDYAIVFEHRPNSPSYSRFCVALANESHGFNTDGRTVRPWYGVEGHADNEEFQRLAGRVRSHRLAGLIFPSSPHPYRHTPLLDEPLVPRVAAMAAPAGEFPNVAAVRFVPLMERALAHLASRGRRNVAIIQGAGVKPPDPELVGRLGLTIRPFMVQGVSYSQPQMARALAHLMVRRQQEDAPDGLVIADDNLLEYASAGILDAGVRVPDELEVVAHCNFPWPTPSPLPVRRLGYDVREFLRHAIESIDEQRRGAEGALRERVLEPKFEDELPEQRGTGL